MCYWDRRKGVRNFLIKPVEKEIHGSQLQQGKFYIVSWLVWMYSQILIIPGWIIQVTGIMSHAALLQPLHALFWEGKFCSVHSYTTLLIFVCFSHFMREPRQAARSSQVFLCDSASLAGRAWKNQPHCKRDKCLGKAEPLPWLCVSTRGVTSLVRAETETSGLTGSPWQGWHRDLNTSVLCWQSQSHPGVLCLLYQFCPSSPRSLSVLMPSCLNLSMSLPKSFICFRAWYFWNCHPLPACCKKPNQPNQPKPI